MTNDRHGPSSRRSSRASLSGASDRVRLGTWLPPQHGVLPRVRFGKRWINLLWILLAGGLLLALGAVLAQQLRTWPGLQEFISRYPGMVPSSQAVRSGFPAWLRWQHFLNAFFMIFIIRSGLQILADHPRLYWLRGSTPGTEWFRFQHDVPQNRVWTSKDDSVTLPAWLGIPGLRHSVGLARWWHFSFDLLWTINGVIFYVLLFATDQWRRLVPTTWAVLPNALSTAVQYWSLQLPAEHAWTSYNALQQLTYFVTVFIAAPLAIVTGLMQGPAISNRLGRFASILSRQAARTIHFYVLCWFLCFIAIHLTLVCITGIRQNLNYMFAGVNDDSWEGFLTFGAAMLVIVAAWWCASPFTIKHARLVQKLGRALVGPIKGVAEQWDPTAEYTEKDVSPYFWVNGTLPRSDVFDLLAKDSFAAYRLQIGGLVKNPQELSLADLRAMPKQEQITEHFCIQGWSGVAKWGGVPMRHILDLVMPTPEARYVVFYSFAEGAEGSSYYDVHTIQNMSHRLTILAYEMNGRPLGFLHGAPLRLRCENELGFKMVKWIDSVEFVSDFAHLGAGQGGYNEDHEFYGCRMPI